MTNVSRPKEPAARGRWHPANSRTRQDHESRVVHNRPAWTYELDHLAALDAARQAARPKVPDRIICHGCGSVPRGRSSRAAYHVSADGTGWECRRYPKCEVE